jgi:sterol desaturase/sphingolipid hydroxylase (fatty acid hydroxylase superfamily)
MNIIFKYIIITIFAGIYVEFIGYIVHRFFIHDGIFSDKMRATHYCHHEIRYPYYDFESEKYRLAHDSIPWVLTIIFSGYIPSILVYLFNYIDISMMIYLLIYFTLHLFFISYIHDSYHIKDHWLNKYEWFKYNKHCHYIHHLDDMNYGITNYVFDKMFGTFSGKIVDKKDNFNGLEITCDDRYKIFDGLPSLVN